MKYRLDNGEFTDRPSYYSDELRGDEFDARVRLDNMIDDWEQSEWLEQFGDNNLDKE